MLKKYKQFKNIRGFTLIELMVVIAIIGALSSILLTFMSNARAQAYDAKKKAELKNIQVALFSYYDGHGVPPSIGGSPYNDSQSNFLQGLVDDHLLPSNPKASIGNYYYYDYGTHNAAGMLVATELEGSPASTGYPGTCRPFPANSGAAWCDQSLNNWYCLCLPYND